MQKWHTNRSIVSLVLRHPYRNRYIVLHICLSLTISHRCFSYVHLAVCFVLGRALTKLINFQQQKT